MRRKNKKKKKTENGALPNCGKRSVFRFGRMVKKKKANLSGGERKLSPVEDIGGDVAYLMGGVGV